MKLIFESKEQVIEWCREHLKASEVKEIAEKKIYVYDFAGEPVLECDSVKEAEQKTGIKSHNIYESIRRGSICDRRFYFARSKNFVPSRLSHNPLYQSADRPLY